MKLQLKRSNVLQSGEAKSPTSDQLDYGELAVNYNNGDPAVFLKDSNDTVIRIAGRGATGLDEDYVNITGDTMTGDLNLGNSSYLRVRKTGDDSSTAIQLSPDGAASFDSTVVVAPGNGRQIELANSPVGGVIYLRENDGTRNIQLDGANGSATFAGDVVIGNDPVSGTLAGIKCYGNAGSISVTGNSAGQNLLLGYTQGNATNTVAITAAGSATFAGGAFKIESDGDISTNIRGQGNIELDSTGAFTNPKVKLFAATGNATFAGDITLGDYATNGSTSGIKINPDNNGNGALVVQGGGTSDMAIGVYDGAAKTYKASVSHDGAATFTGSVTSDVDSQYGGSFQAQNINGDGYLWKGYDSTGNPSSPSAATGLTSWIKASGRATFASRVNCGDNTVNDVAIKAENNSTTATVYAQQFNDAGGVWSGRNKDNEETSWIDVVGNASFDGTVEVGDSTPWSSPTKTGTYMAAGGSVETYRDVNGSTNGAYAAYYKNPNGNNDKVFSVNMDGSGEFTGQVSVSDFSNTSGSILYSSGEIYAKVAAGSADAVTPLKIYKGNDIVASVYANGGAVFSGDVNCANDKIRAVTSSSAGLLRILNSSSVDTIGLDGSNGSATFAGAITANGYSMASLAQL